MILYYYFSEEYQKWRTKDENQNSSAFFCLKINQVSEGSAETSYNHENVTFTTIQNGLQQEDSIIAFADPCTIENHPGWPLRNLLLLIAKFCPVRLQEGLNILCFRQQIVKGGIGLPNKITAANSMILRVKLICEEPSEKMSTSKSLKDIFETCFKGKTNYF